MAFRSVLFISLILSHFAVQGLAQTDSVYSRMILGSAGYKTIFGSPDQYARSQVEIILRLTSIELAERTVRKCLGDLQTKHTEASIKADARSCSSALKVHITSGDTAFLALGDPKLPDISANVYLNNLMFILIEDHLTFAYVANQRSLDSLDKLLDVSYLQLMNARDTLNSFCNTVQFRTATHSLLYQLLDTVAAMKTELMNMGYQPQDITMMFYQLDTAMHRLKLGYADMTSDQWDPKFAGAGLAVYDCEYILYMLRCNINATIIIFADPANYPSLSQSERGAAYPTLHGILTGDLVAHFYNYSYVESRTPVLEITFSTAQNQYLNRSEAYYEMLSIRTNTLIQRATIFPRAYILCTASKIKC